MNIIITGANGFVGRALCKYMCQKGLDVNALVRKAVADLPVTRQQIIPDYLEFTDFPTVLKGMDVVIHTAGLAHVKGRPDQDYFEINTEITKKLALECVKAKVRRFVYISTTHVHASSSCKGILKTSSPHNPTSAYGKSKLQAEEVLRDIEKKHGLEVVIIRPPLVYGPGAAGNVRLLMKAIQKNIPFPFAGIDNRRSMVFIDNLVDAITAAATHVDAKGHTYFVSDERSLSIQDLICGLGKGLGKNVRLFHFPQSLLRIPLKLMGKQEMLDKITGSFELDTSDIAKTINWKPIITTKEGLKRTAQGF